MLDLNLPGVDGLVLDGPTVAKIFGGKITTYRRLAEAVLADTDLVAGDDVTVAAGRFFFRSLSASRPKRSGISPGTTPSR